MLSSAQEKAYTASEFSSTVSIHDNHVILNRVSGQISYQYYFRQNSILFFYHIVYLCPIKQIISNFSK